MIRPSALALSLLLALPFAGVGWAGEHDDDALPDEDLVTEQEQEADEQIRTWEERMQAFGRQADELSREARERLERSWEETREERERLSEASREQWERARARLNDAMDRLERAWEAATEERESDPPED